MRSPVPSSHQPGARERPRCESVNKPSKLPRHWEGVLDSGGVSSPALRFSFLREPKAHNFDAAIEQLGDHARALVGDPRR